MSEVIEDITRNGAFHCSARFHSSATYMAALCELLRALTVSWESSRDLSLHRVE